MHWQVQDATERFSELVGAAKTRGPQFITRDGAEEAVVVGIEDYRRLTAASSFKELLREPPYIDDFPDASEVRRELPRESDWGLDRWSHGFRHRTRSRESADRRFDVGAQVRAFDQ